MPKTIHSSLRGGLLFLFLFLLGGGLSLSAQLTVELEGEDPICSGLASGSITSTVSGGTLPYTYNWSTGDETEFIENLTAGTYTLIVTDGDDNTDTASITLIEPPLVTLVVSTDQNCEAPFTLTADAGGGVGDFIYNWSTGEDTPSIVVNDESEYCVTVVDENGCGTFECITPESNPPSVDVVAVDVLCFGDENGTLTATGSEGTPPYNYEWSNGEEGATITGLAPGTYTVVLTDANGCMATATGTVDEPPELTTVTTSQHDVCPGEATASIMTVPSGGTPPYTYLWSTGAVTQGVATLPGGTYSVTVTDDNGCTVVDEVTVFELDGPEVTIEGESVICGDGNMNELTAVATGGTGNYQFEWSTGEFVPTITVGPGTYSVTVEDGNGCTDADTITVIIVDVSIELSSTDVLCSGDDNGTATVTVMGGDEPYDYDWSTGDETPMITGLAPGTYMVTVTEANGCKAIGMVTINEPPVLELDGVAIDPLCVDDENGSIDITAIGGTQPYSYDWADLPGNNDPEDRDNLEAGTYTVVVTDANDCTVSETFTLEEPAELDLDADVTDVLCNGDETGAIDVTVSGGTPPYAFDWADLAGDDNDEDREDLSAGTYTVEVTDANGCTAIESFTINEPPVLTIDADATDVLCAGDETGSIDVTVSGGTPPYAYDWADLAGDDNNEDREDLPAGTYMVVVTDVNGCTISTSVTINEPPALQISADETDVLCNGDETGAIDITVVGGTQPYAYDWADLPGDDNDEDREDLPAGTYTVEVTDANGCTISTSVTINEPPALEISAMVTDVLCNGDATGAIDLTVTGGTPPYTFSWSNGEETEDLDNLPAGDYTGTATDANGCTISATVTVGEPPTLEVSAEVTNVLCNGEETGAIDLTVMGGTPPYTFSWSNGEGTEDLDNLPAGDYTGTVTDANGCVASATLTVTEPPALEISADETDVLCNGDETGAIDITVVGGTQPYAYDWADLAGDDNDEDREDLPAGTYTVVVTDANGCTISTSVTINEPPALEISAMVTDVLCNGDATGAIDLTVTGGTPPYTFSWSNGEETEDLDNLPAGDYTGTATDANGCTISATVTVGEPDPLGIVASVTNVLCNGEATGSINITVSGGTPPYTYDWADLPGDDNPEDRENLTAGSYTLMVTDANGCTLSATMMVLEPETIEIDITVTDVLCNGDATGIASVSVDGGTPPYSYDWSDLPGDDDPADRDDLVAGSYTLTVTDLAGCTASETITVDEPTELSCEVEILQQPTMGDNGSLTVNAEGGTPPYSYEWSTTEVTQTISGLSPGTYTVTVTDDNGCTTVCSATLEAFSGIGDFVWEDFDLDGLQDDNEPGVPGITVNLKDEDGNVIDMTTTDEDGFYSFMGLTPGTYSIQFIVPDTMDYTASNIGADDTIDSDIIPGMMGMTGQYTLAPGEFNMTVDAGIIVPPNGAISDPCFCLNNATTDNDGQFSEQIEIRSYPGQTWTIIARTNMFVDDPTNEPPNLPEEIPIGTTLTEVEPGVYQLDFRLVDELTYTVSLQSGEFVLEISNTCFYPDIFFEQGPPEELCVFDPAFPLDANSNIPGEFTYIIAGQEVDVLDPSTLPEGTYNLQVTLEPFDEDECIAVLNIEFDIANNCPAKIGDFVWFDEDGDGIQDPGEDGIEGVKVIVTSQDGTFMDMQLTDENGMYMFMVDPGTYKITFEQPDDLNPSPQDEGSDDTIDSDMNPGTLMTGFYTLGPDEINLTVDAGFTVPCPDNISDPGTIGFDQEVCGPGNVPNTLVEVTPATGGVGEIEYLWMYNTVDPGQDISFWHPIPNTNSVNYSPGPLQQTTYFTRCVRRLPDCPYLESNIVTVTVGDDAVALIGGPNLGCEEEEITFTSEASGPGATISWSVSGDGDIIGDNDEESVTVVWGSFGVHSVTLTVTENGCTSTRTRTVSIVTNPMVCGGNFTASGTVNNVASRELTIEWFLPNDGYEMFFEVERSTDGTNFELAGEVIDPETILGETALYQFDDVAPVAGRNYYRVIARDAWGENMTSNVVELQLAEASDQMARIYPNPTTSGMVHVEMLEQSASDEAIVIEFISITGGVISSQTLDVMPDFFDLPIDDQAAGFYFVRITCGDKVETHRVLVNE